MKNLMLGAAVVVLLSGCDFLDNLFAGVGEVCRPSRIDVTTLSDPDIGEAVCRPDGPCPLRAAINTANLCGTEKTIVLQDQATYSPERLDPFSERTNANGEPVGNVFYPPITGRVTIEGNGSALFGDSSALLARYFYVTPRGSLTLENLTLGPAGLVEAANFSGVSGDENTREQRVRGGGVYNLGEFETRGVKFNAVRAITGGALANLGTATIGPETEFNDNVAVTAGAIYNDGRLSVDGGTFLRNRSVDRSSGAVSDIFSRGGNAAIANAAFIDSIGVTAVQNADRVEGSTFVNDGLRNPRQTSVGVAMNQGLVRSSTFVMPRGSGIGCARSDLRVDIWDTTESSMYGVGGLFETGCRFNLINTVLDVENSCSSEHTHVGGTGNLATRSGCGVPVVDDVQLGPLTRISGKLVLPPEPTSPLIDAGDLCFAADQVGNRRPMGEACDIGAVELR